MSTRQMDVPLERVFAVLATPATYADWVVGSDIIRGAELNWPAVRSRLDELARRYQLT